MSLYDNCGTTSGYQRHIKFGTKTCGPCKKANAAYIKEYRHRKGHNKARLIPDTILKQHGIKVDA